jgi:hypothetical protein
MLAPPDIDGIETCRTAGDQDLGEAAGRSPNVDRHAPLGVEAEGVEPGFELESAAGNISAGLRADGQLGVGENQSAQLGLRLAAHADAAAPDQVGGAGASRRQPVVHQ